MQQVDDITLIKQLGKGSFGEVYLTTKKGRNVYYATKKIERKIADKPSIKKYFDNELDILRQLNHPNIVRLEEMKQSKDHYYIVMEYINGGGLSDCLKKYIQKHNKAFPEEIVQYLMKQIVDALYYLHNRKIIHRDLKLDNIMVNFDSDYDREILNMMKAKIKIIDFGFAIQLDKAKVTFSAVGSPINMDPIILNKFCQRKDVNLGYDTKADIWSTGTIFYELLTGKAVFSAKTMTDLANKVDDGKYQVPKSVSKEAIEFLSGMLLYDSKCRMSAEQLLKQPFLTKNVNDFTFYNSGKDSKDISKNKPIMGNLDNLDKINLGKGGIDAPIPEDEFHEKKPVRRKSTKRHSDKVVYNYNDNKGLNNQNTNNNLDKNNNNLEKNLRRAQTHRQMPMGNYPGYGQFGFPQMVVPQMNMQQQPMYYFVPMAYNYPAVYQENQQKDKPKKANNQQKPYSNKNLTNKYYVQYNNQLNDDDGCSIQ